MIPENLREALTEKLEEVTDTAFAYVHASNWDVANNETLLDLAVSTGCMLTLPGDTRKPLNYVPVSISEVALEEGPWGGVGGLYRKHKVKIENIKGQWADAKVPADWLRKAKDDPNAEVTLCEATYVVRFTDGTDDYGFCYDLIDEKDKARILERSYGFFPWLTPRWLKLPGETYGRGPVIQALPDIKTLNKVVELVLRNCALSIAGVYTGVDDGTLNPSTARIVPGAIIPVASNGGTRGPSLQALERSGDFNIAALQIEDLRMHVKRMLFDRQLPPDAGPVRSATEIVERIKELARDIGAPFGRLHTEYITPWFQNTLHILADRGLVPRIDIDGVGVTVQVISPLAQEQNFAEVEVVVRWIAILASLGQELVMLTAKTEELGEWMGTKLGVPGKLIRDKTERGRILDEIKSQVAQQMSQKISSGNVVPIGTGAASPQIQTAAASAGVAPYAQAA
jgi:hypothetical protein